MPATLSYPGVYIEELPSGVRAIAGVSTSVAAFVGTAKRGPIDKAVRILSYADYERRFGGLDSSSEMSYAVRQFFLNGGTEAWIVRLVGGAKPASVDLQTGEQPPQTALTITARDAGVAANDLEVVVDYRTGSPGSTFNLTIQSAPGTDPNTAQSERFERLSMNPDDVRYVKDVIKETSDLVTVEVAPAALASVGNVKGQSKSGSLADPAHVKITATNNTLNISANGLDPVVVKLSTGDLSLAAIATKIQTEVKAHAQTKPAYENFTCSATGNVLVLTSGEAGKASTVRVLPSDQNDAAPFLKLGAENGGSDVDATGTIRPVAGGTHGTLTGAEFDATKIAFTNDRFLKVKLDDFSSVPVKLPKDTPATMAGIAAALEAAVSGAKAGFAAFTGFKVATSGADATATLKLTSGSLGGVSKVRVEKGADDSGKEDPLADELKLSDGTGEAGATPRLSNGSETPLTDNGAPKAYSGDRGGRKGIYALEAVDLFNLLCLPGVSQSGILNDAASYCAERRAFFLIDSPFDKENAEKVSPDVMEAYVTGTELPKSRNAAVFYPWPGIADPLREGRTRYVGPCGTVAGLFARTDASRGVWKAPAGTEATLVGVQKLAYKLTDLENGILNPRGVNCLRIFPGFGPVSWGSRTLRGDDNMADEWKYVPVRRLALFLEESLYRGTKWAVFEPNDEPLWAQLRLNINSFMQGLFRQGAFQGQTPRDAYFVRVDKSTTTQTDIDLGIVNIHVGFAPLKPAEFVVLKFQQKTQQATA